MVTLRTVGIGGSPPSVVLPIQFPLASQLAAVTGVEKITGGSVYVFSKETEVQTSESEIVSWPVS